MNQHREAQTICWVYITRTPRTDELFICYTLNLADELARNPHLILLYYRRFENIHDAIGHKLLLEQLSTASVSLIINRLNPHDIDLRNEFKNNKP